MLLNSLNVEERGYGETKLIVIVDFGIVKIISLTFEFHLRVIFYYNSSLKFFSNVRRVHQSGTTFQLS